MTYNEGHSRSLILTLVDRPRQWLLVTLFAMLHCFHDVSTLDCLWPWEILQQSASIWHLVHCSHVSASSFVCEKLSWHMLHFVIYMWVKTGVKQVNWHSRSFYSLSRSLILSTFDDRHSRSLYSLSRSLILLTFDDWHSRSFYSLSRSLILSTFYDWHLRSFYSMSRSLILSTFDDWHSRSFYSLLRSLILSTFDVSSSTSFTVVASRFKRSCSLYHRGWRDICLVCLQQQLSL